MTRDLDFTYRTSIYKKEHIIEILQDIISTSFDSFFEYSLVDIHQAQEDKYHFGFVVMLEARQGKSVIKLKLDISNNTLIYPEASSTSLNSLFSNDVIRLHTYALETIIAEKFETTLDRGEFNGRIRDLVDVYLLMKNNVVMIDENLLADTIVEVSKDRDTLDNLDDFDEIIELLSVSKIFNENFNRYMSNQYPDMLLTLEEVFDEFRSIHKMIVNFKKEK